MKVSKRCKFYLQNYNSIAEQLMVSIAKPPKMLYTNSNSANDYSSDMRINQKYGDGWDLQQEMHSTN